MQSLINSCRIALFMSLLTLGISLSFAHASEHANGEIRSMPLTNTAGDQCQTTGVRVEQVIPQAEKEELVISIPSQAVAEKPQLRLYKLDNTAFAFEAFKELHDDDYHDRRTFSVVVAKSENLSFKVGFSSVQEDF
ncbi:MAG: hypothetical protein AAF993_00200 [Pseudomonadota bacterium]